MAESVIRARLADRNREIEALKPPVPDLKAAKQPDRQRTTGRSKRPAFRRNNFITPGKGSQYEPKRGYRGVHGGFRRQATPIPLLLPRERRGQSKSWRQARNSQYLHTCTNRQPPCPTTNGPRIRKPAWTQEIPPQLHPKVRRNAFELKGIPAVHPPKFKGLSNHLTEFMPEFTGQPIPLGYHTVSRDNPPVSRQLARD